MKHQLSHEEMKQFLSELEQIEDKINELEKTKPEHFIFNYNTNKPEFDTTVGREWYQTLGHIRKQEEAIFDKYDRKIFWDYEGNSDDTLRALRWIIGYENIWERENTELVDSEKE